MLLFVLLFTFTVSAECSRNSGASELLGDVIRDIRNGSYNVPYNGTVMSGTEVLFVFQWTTDQNASIRVTTASRNSSMDAPMLIVIKQVRGVQSWTLPLDLENNYPYHIVSRTLCPGYSLFHSNNSVLVDISTSSTIPVDYYLLVTVIDDFTIGMDDSRALETSPSQPLIYKFDFSKDIDFVTVNVQSDANLCGLISVQDAKCPVYDFDHNLEAMGYYQSFTSLAAMTVRRIYFDSTSFYVVVAVKPKDMDCQGMESIMSSAGPVDPMVPYRVKNITLNISSPKSSWTYWVGISSACAAYAVVYLIYFFVEINPRKKKDWSVERRHVVDGHSHESLGALTSIQGREMRSTYGAINGSANDQLAEPLGAATSSQERETRSAYGPINGSADDDQLDVRFNEPPDEQDSDESNESDGLSESASLPENDYDFLQDADSDKNIFRTKTILYVSDLSRKDKKYLNLKYKVYPRKLLIIAVFYALPVIQLVLTYQRVLNQSGNEDLCYYNFLCTRPLSIISAFNNVISNMGYVLLGLLFLIIVYRRNRRYRNVVAQHPHVATKYGIPHHYGLFYAMGLALMIEGIMSACYHVCPSYNNFQFDTSFMYIMAVLNMLKIYQTRHPDINPHAHVAYMFIAAVVLVGVLGVLYGSVYFWAAFGVVYFSMCIIISSQIYYMGRWKFNLGVFKRLFLMVRQDRFHCLKPMYCDRMILIFIANGVNIALCVFGLMTRPSDFPTYFLSIFISNLMLYFIYYIIMKVRCQEKIPAYANLFSLIALVLWGFALYFFTTNLTSWEATPAKSREGNHACVLFDFFDYHDIWHFLSSSAMFFSFLVLLTLDDALWLVDRDKILVF